MTTVPVYVDDIIGEVVADMQDFLVSKNPDVTFLDSLKANETAALGSSLIQQIRFSKSSFDELIETLMQEDKSGTGRFTKYPLVHLVQDMRIDRGADVGLFGTGFINIIFIHQTRQAYKIDDRDELVFKPVLWPMYYMFLERLKFNNWIFETWDVTGEFRHSITKRAFWGNRQLKGSANILNDYVDALELNIQIKFNFTNC